MSGASVVKLISGYMVYLQLGVLSKVRMLKQKPLPVYLFGIHDNNLVRLYRLSKQLLYQFNEFSPRFIGRNQYIYCHIVYYLTYASVFA